MKKLAVLLVCLLAFGVLAPGMANAGQAASSTISLSAESGQAKNDSISFNQWIKDTGDILTSPKHWDASDWNKSLLYGGVAYLLYDNDKHTQHWFQEKRSNHTDQISKIGNAFPTVGTAYFAGTYFFGNEQQRTFAANGLESVAVASLLTEGIKVATHRQRPDGSDHKSFPSGHVTAAFAVATTIADEYPNDKAVPYLAYGLATLTGYARLNDNRHWGSDVFVGALIGHYTAKTVKTLNASKGIRLQPYAALGTTGVVMSKQY